MKCCSTYVGRAIPAQALAGRTATPKAPIMKDAVSDIRSGRRLLQSAVVSGGPISVRRNLAATVVDAECLSGGHYCRYRMQVWRPMRYNRYLLS
jgi:hypothetical protein